MIVSRMAELARLDALYAALVRGEGGALVVHGEAGIGKTTLLEALVERCGDTVTVLRACGAETEAELAFSALHRACRRPDARQHLRTALEGFERLHARAWASQAEAELRAAGGRHRPPQDDRALTPQERRVAAAVQRGASNRDIAAGLFLSPKTVEFHLRQIYRKLDVHSRTQLVAALAEKDAAS
jgi:DNA-binding NarL/FixJ family response regulator